MVTLGAPVRCTDDIATLQLLQTNRLPCNGVSSFEGLSCVATVTITVRKSLLRFEIHTCLCVIVLYCCEGICSHLYVHINYFRRCKLNFSWHLEFDYREANLYDPCKQLFVKYLFLSLNYFKNFFILLRQ